jgi:hypothetical protein
MNQLERLRADAEADLFAAESSAFQEARFDGPEECGTATRWLRPAP